MAAALLALALPAGASAKSRIVLCLQGSQTCHGANKVEVPAPISEAVVPSILGRDGTSRGEALWTALDVCSKTLGRIRLPGYADGVFVCRDMEVPPGSGSWYETSVAGHIQLRCGVIRDAPDVSYRFCFVSVLDLLRGPFARIDEDRNYLDPP